MKPSDIEIRLYNHRVNNPDSVMPLEKALSIASLLNSANDDNWYYMAEAISDDLGYVVCFDENGNRVGRL